MLLLIFTVSVEICIYGHLVGLWLARGSYVHEIRVPVVGVFVSLLDLMDRRAQCPRAKMRNRMISKHAFENSLQGDCDSVVRYSQHFVQAMFYWCTSEIRDKNSSDVLFECHST